jgi:MarR family transcriptional regulator, transcriptional regulator for hemolysin
VTAPPAQDVRSAFAATLGKASRQWRYLVDSRLKAFGLTEATWRPLLHVSKFASAPRQKDLAESLGIEGPSLVRLLDALERDGFIVRRGTTDRRTKAIHLTPRGEKLGRKIDTVVAGVREEVLAGISDAELGAAFVVLETIQRSIAARTGAAKPVRPRAGRLAAGELLRAAASRPRGKRA